MSLRKRTTPGEIVAAIVLAGAAGAIWAGMNGYEPEGIGRGLGKIIGIPIVLALVAFGRSQPRPKIASRRKIAERYAIDEAKSQPAHVRPAPPRKPASAIARKSAPQVSAPIP